MASAGLDGRRATELSGRGVNSPMKAIELKMPDKVYRKLAGLAAHNRQAVDKFALRKLAEIVQAVEDFAQLEHRARRGSLRKFKAAVAKVPKGPPVPGDELAR